MPTAQPLASAGLTLLVFCAPLAASAWPGAAQDATHGAATAPVAATPVAPKGAPPAGDAPAAAESSAAVAAASGDDPAPADASGDDPAPADASGADPAPADDPLGLVIGAKLGLGYGGLGGALTAELELGYDLPLHLGAPRALRVFLAGQYAAPTLQRDADPDPRLPPGSPPGAHLTQRQLTLTLGLLYHLPLAWGPVHPYVAAGARLMAQATTTRAQAGGEDFGEHREADARLGPYGAIGCEFELGPGAALAELQAAYTALDGRIFEDHHAGGAALALGYRLTF